MTTQGRRETLFRIATYTGFNYYRASGASRLQIATTDIMHHAMRLENYH